MSKMRELIQKLVLIKNAQREEDKEKLWDYYEPGNPADIREIKILESKLKLKLSEEYIDFLLCANGWRCFYQDVNLFGTFDYGQKIVMDAEQLLKAEMLYNNNLAEIRNYLLPIAAAQKDKDIFVLVLTQNEHYGEVIWLAGGEIETFPSFYKFFEEMIEYNKDELDDIIRDNRK